MTDYFLLFCVEEVRFALDVAIVQRVVRAAEITLLPEAPAFVRGLINVAGDITPVIDMRKRLGLPSRELELHDQFILINSAGTPLALLVDRVDGVVELADNLLTSMKTTSSDTLTTATTVEGCIILIQPVNWFVSESTVRQLENIGKQGIDE